MRSISLLMFALSISCVKKNEALNTRDDGDFDPTELEYERSLNSGLGLSKDRVVIAGLGDSIAAGFNAKRKFANRDMSFVTGSAKEIQSLYKDAKQLYADKQVVATARQVSGSKSDALLRQAQGIRDTVIKYAAISIGANDLLQGLVNDDAGMARFVSNVESTVQILARKQAKVDIMAVPGFAHLYALGVSMGCQSTWNGFLVNSFAPPLFGKSATDETRQAVEVRRILLNQKLEEIAARNSQNVKYIARPGTEPFKANHISKHDCFHPSVDGQNFLATTIYNDGWFQGGANKI